MIILPESAEGLCVLLLVIIPPETEVLVLHDPGPGPHHVGPLQPDHLLLLTVAAVLVAGQFKAVLSRIHADVSHFEMVQGLIS